MPWHEFEGSIISMGISLQLVQFPKDKQEKYRIQFNQRGVWQKCVKRQSIDSGVRLLIFKSWFKHLATGCLEQTACSLCASDSSAVKNESVPIYRETRDNLAEIF